MTILLVTAALDDCWTIKLQGKYCLEGAIILENGV
jgi:hypothetical protein